MSAALTEQDLSLTMPAQDKLSELFFQIEDNIQGVRVFANSGRCSGISSGMTFTDSVNDNDGVLEVGGSRSSSMRVHFPTCAGSRSISSIAATATPASCSTISPAWEVGAGPAERQVVAADSRFRMPFSPMGERNRVHTGP